MIGANDMFGVFACWGACLVFGVCRVFAICSPCVRRVLARRVFGTFDMFGMSGVFSAIDMFVVFGMSDLMGAI